MTKQRLTPSEKIPVYAVIKDWCIVECTQPLPAGDVKTRHILGRIVSHDHLPTGEPYIGSPLRGYSYVRNTALGGFAVNSRGKVILLKGPPLTDAPLPADYRAMQARAAAEWAIPDRSSLQWQRVFEPRYLFGAPRYLLGAELNPKKRGKTRKRRTRKDQRA
jgi:hypothetical protein